MDLPLGFLFWSIHLYICLCANTILSWWLWLCRIVWSQAGWFLQFHSSFSRLLWLFKDFFISIQIVKLFVLGYDILMFDNLYLNLGKDSFFSLLKLRSKHPYISIVYPRDVWLYFGDHWNKKANEKEGWVCDESRRKNIVSRECPPGTGSLWGM